MTMPLQKFTAAEAERLAAIEAAPAAPESWRSLPLLDELEAAHRDWMSGKGTGGFAIAGVPKLIAALRAVDALADEWMRDGSAPVQALTLRAALSEVTRVSKGDDVLAEIAAERTRQDAKWGEQNHPDGTGPDVVWTFTGPAGYVRECAQATTDDAASRGDVTWRDIALEEVAEAFAERDQDRLRAELIQAAAVFVQWAQAIDRRRAAALQQMRDERSHAAMLGSAHIAGGHL